MMSYCKDLKACNFIKKRLHSCFPVNITNFYEQLFYRTSLVAAYCSDQTNINLIFFLSS